MTTASGSSSSTRLVLHEVLSDGRKISKVDDSLTTKSIPMPLVKNIMTLHESGAPGAIKGFARSTKEAGIMGEIFSEAMGSFKSGSSDPEKLFEAFYATTILNNEQAKKCLLYSQGGCVVAMAQIGNFVPEHKDLSCTIGNFVVSPKLSESVKSAIVKHVAVTAQKEFGEASLITPEKWSKSYEEHGFVSRGIQQPSKISKCIFSDGKGQ